MKKFTKKGILQKTIIAILVAILISNFIVPTLVRAEDETDDEDTLNEVGGVLFKPIQFLSLGIGDTLMYLANACAYGVDIDPILTLSTSTKTFFERIGLAVQVVSNNYIALQTGVVDPYFGVSRQENSNGENVEEYVNNVLPEEIDIPIFLVSPEKIFSGEVALLDINIINPNTKYVDNNGNEIESTPAQVLQETIASWYVALRNLAIVGLLSVLVYVGIRIIMSSTASDKAKYKQMFTDWLVAICLLFFMHYIMSFSITMVESITDAIKQTNERLAIPFTPEDLADKYNVSPEQLTLLEGLVLSGGEVSEGDENGAAGNIGLDLMGLARFKAQLKLKAEGENGEQLVAEGGRQQMAYTIIYLVLVIYTIMFLFVYIKRLIYIIFLTMIAPLVALTYPIDKITDGQAQAFNMWLKEYVYNLLIQPFHLLIYNVLLGSAMSLASQYLIYPLVVLGFMLQAEKILRRFFGFEKSSTASSLASGALGGAAVMSVINMLGNRTKKALKGGKDGGSSGKDDGKIRMDERGADDSSGEDDFIVNALNGADDENNNEQQILDKYSSEGFGKNDKGEYFNPWTNEYDADYSPLTDKHYNPGMNNLNKNNSDATTDSEPKSKGKLATKFDEIKGKLANSERMQELKNVGGVFLSGAKTLGKGARYVAPRLAKGVAEAGIKTVAAGVTTTAAIAGALASDDDANITKYVPTAAAIGLGFGGNVADKVVNLPSNAYRKGSDAIDAYRQQSYSQEQYQKLKNRKLDNEFMRSKENQELYRQKFGEDKVSNSDGKQVAAYELAMEKALEYRKHGVTNNDIIIKAMKVNSNDWADRRKIVSAKFASQVSNEKDIETLQKRLKDKGIKEPQIKEQSDMIRKIRGLY